jgi:hypothetical protein
MNGELGIGTFIAVFVTVLVGAVLLTAVASSAATVSQTGYANRTTGDQQVTIGTLGTITCLTGQELLDTPVVINSSGGATITSGNYSITEAVCSTTGVKSVVYTQNAINDSGHTFNISYTYGVDGYADNSGARAVSTLIIIFMALAVTVVALTPVMRSKIVDFMRR